MFAMIIRAIISIACDDISIGYNLHNVLYERLALDFIAAADLPVFLHTMVICFIIFMVEIERNILPQQSNHT